MDEYVPEDSADGQLIWPVDIFTDNYTSAFPVQSRSLYSPLGLVSPK